MIDLITTTVEQKRELLPIHIHKVYNRSYMFNLDSLYKGVSLSIFRSRGVKPPQGKDKWD